MVTKKKVCGSIAQESHLDTTSFHCIDVTNVASLGTYIHPSAYIVYDIDYLITMYKMKDLTHNTKHDMGDKFLNGFQLFRGTFEWTSINCSWDAINDEVDDRLTAIRILVCGNAGIGKSTLINKTFGLPLVIPSHHNVQFDKLTHV